MPKIITDQEIQSFISEQKILPENFHFTLRTRNFYQNYQREISTKDHQFLIIVRRTIGDPLNFSVVIGVKIQNKWFRLRRYNGNYHTHKNKLEQMKFHQFHIHKATERYQLNDLDEDQFAEPTTAYTDLDGAFQLALQENNFKTPTALKHKLLDEFLSHSHNIPDVSGEKE
jgi:hypothetical protein